MSAGSHETGADDGADDRPDLVADTETQPGIVAIQEELSTDAWIEITSDGVMPARWIDHEPDDPAPDDRDCDGVGGFEYGSWTYVQDGDDDTTEAFIRSTESVGVER